MTFPLSYQNYEKKVFDKFSKLYTQTSSEEKENKKILEHFLNDEGRDYMKTTYKETRDRYYKNLDNWKKLGLSEDEIINRLINYPVNTLEMLLL